DGLSAPPELQWSCQPHANLPPLGPSRRTPNQGPFPLHPFCCRVDPNGTVDPSDTQRCFRLIAEVRAATPRSTGSPALRRALCRRATPTTPVSDPAVMGRLLRRDPSAFPVRMAGRRSQRPFRVEACSGFIRIAARRLADPPLVGRCSESFSDSVALLAASVATGTYRQLPGQDFHLQETRPLSAVHIRTVFQA